MNKELIIRSNSDAVDFALLKDGKLIELHQEKEKIEGNTQFQVGDIFIAKIRKPVAGLNAAFVNLGHEKDAFLHYHDLGPNLASYLKTPVITSSALHKSYYKSCMSPITTSEQHLSVRCVTSNTKTITLHTKYLSN